MADPCADEEVRSALTAVPRIMQWKQKQAPALTAAVFRKIKEVACRPRVGRGGHMERPETALVRGRTDIAMIALMRDCMLRVGETSAAIWGDIVSDPDGNGTLWIPKSKTDQNGEGDVGFISADTMKFLNDIRGPGVAPGDSVLGLRPNQIYRRIKRAALEAGLGEDFSAHFPRVGMAVDLADSGASNTQMMNAGRWSSPRMPALYTRRQAAKRNAVARYYNPNDASESDS